MLQHHWSARVNDCLYISEKPDQDQDHINHYGRFQGAVTAEVLVKLNMQTCRSSSVHKVCQFLIQ